MADYPVFFLTAHWGGLLAEECARKSIAALHVPIKPGTLRTQ
jgi:hypothetical protein